jgi:hypothetical protein
MRNHEAQATNEIQKETPRPNKVAGGWSLNKKQKSEPTTSLSNKIQNKQHNSGNVKG